MPGLPVKFKCPLGIAGPSAALAGGWEPGCVMVLRGDQDKALTEKGGLDAVKGHEHVERIDGLVEVQFGLCLQRQVDVGKRAWTKQGAPSQLGVEIEKRLERDPGKIDFSRADPGGSGGSGVIDQMIIVRQ